MILDFHKLHVELWQWLVDNPLMEKSDWPGWDEFNNRNDALEDCFACAIVNRLAREYDLKNKDLSDYIYLTMAAECEKFCPLFKVMGSCDNDSIFKKWEHAKADEDIESYIKYAKLIRDAQWIGEKMYDTEYIWKWK